MRTQRTRARRASGNIYLKKGARGATWHMRYRLPDGTESRRLIGPAWTERGRTPDSFFTKRTAQAELQAFLTDARRGLLPEKQRQAVTVAQAANEWLRHAEYQRRVKPATLADYKGAVKTHVVPAFGDRRIEEITSRHVDRWQTRLSETNLSARTQQLHLWSEIIKGLNVFRLSDSTTAGAMRLDHLNPQTQEFSIG